MLVDQLKGLGWAARSATFHSKVTPGVFKKVRQYIGVLLGVREG